MINYYDQRFPFLRRGKIERQSTEQGKRKSKHFVHCCLQALCLTETKQTTHRERVCLFPVRNTQLNNPAKAARQWESTRTVCVLVIRPRGASCFLQSGLGRAERHFLYRGDDRDHNRCTTLTHTRSPLQKPRRVSAAPPAS